MSTKPWSVVDDAELEQLRERDRLLTALIDDMDQAIVAHDTNDPRHRSNGGQHTNGRCCPFGNLNPSAVGVFRRWVAEARNYVPKPIDSETMDLVEMILKDTPFRIKR